VTSRNKYYKDYLNENSKADPWTDLANAIVAQAADDYRRLCKKMVEYGATMEEFSFRILDGRIREIKWFFESDYGFLLSHGLAPVIWEKLQAEFADGIEEMLVKREERIENKKEDTK
jgi:hypothetical protein